MAVTAEIGLDNWFPYNFYCCSNTDKVLVELIIGFLIISTVVAKKRGFGEAL